MDQIDYILNQTELSTIVCSPDKVSTVVKMKKDGLAPMVKNLVVMDDKNPSEI